MDSRARSLALVMTLGLSLGALASCASDTDGEDDLNEACDCIPSTFTAATIDDSCGQALLCDLVTKAVETGAPDQIVEVDAAALDCALTALTEGTPGLIRWREDFEGGVDTNSGYVLIRDDGLALWREDENYDLGGVTSEARLFDLSASSAYDSCVGQSDDSAGFDCLQAPPQQSVDICAPELPYDEF